MERRLDAVLARLASLAATQAQRAEWIAQGQLARSLLAELKQTHGFVWEVRRDEIEKAILRLGRRVTS